MDLQDMNSRVAPLAIKYSQMTPLGLAGSSKKVKFFPQNAGIFTKTNNIIRIPISSSSCFLDGTLSFLKFSFKNTSVAKCRFDNSAHSLISRMRIMSKSGGGDIEDIRQYAYLHSMLSDLQLSVPERHTRYHEGFGCAGMYPNGMPAFTVAAQTAGAWLAGGAVVAGQVAGALAAQAAINVAAVGAVSATALGTQEPEILVNGTFTAVLPLLSSVLGSNATKYLPLFLTGEVVLEIELGLDGTVSTEGDNEQKI